jgi:hypothetical protein
VGKARKFFRLVARRQVYVGEAKFMDSDRFLVAPHAAS